MYQGLEFRGSPGIEQVTAFGCHQVMERSIPYLWGCQAGEQEEVLYVRGDGFSEGVRVCSWAFFCKLVLPSQAGFAHRVRRVI
jgi:hypothetical protein